jgi:hypothetical protein
VLSPKVRDRLAGGLPLLALLPLLIRHEPILPVLRVLHVFSIPLAVLVVGCVLVRLLPARLATPRLAFAIGTRLGGWRGCALVFLATLAAVSLVRSQLISPRPDDPRREHLLTGDEPAYLLLAHSLVFDGDLNVFNNREQNDSRYFYSRPLLGPGQFGFNFYNQISGGRLAGREQDWVGREYLVNRPGLPILIAPAYWVGFHSQLRIRFAVLVWMNLLAATLGVVTFLLARAVSRAPGPSAVAALLVALTPPLLYYSTEIYPELPAGLFTAGALLGLLRARDRWTAFMTGFLIASLPWFNERFLAVTLVLGAAGLARQSLRRHALPFGLPIILSLILEGLYDWGFFGVPFPLNSRKPLALSAIPTGLLAILTDRDRGLVFLNPLLALAVVGLIPLRRHHPWLAGTLIALLTVYLLPIAAFPDWHGGVCPPLRYLAPLAPLLVVPLVTLFQEKGWPLTRAALGVFGAWSAWIGLLLASQPKLLFWTYGAIFHAEAFHPAHGFFPGYFHPARGAVLGSLLWLGLLALFPALDWMLARAGLAMTPRMVWQWLPIIIASGILAVSLVSAGIG